MASKLDRPIRLLPIFRERVWGRDDLAPFFPYTSPTKRIGEAWFTSAENKTDDGTTLADLLRARPDILGTAADPAHPDLCPLLVKLLFTSERLSVQVHPDDAYAQRHHKSLGKTEAWYVLDSEPPGEIAVGFRQKLTTQRLRSAAESGEIEQLLFWQPVKRGDVIYVPAGTVHAIGAGLTICEIQENSDITYRLYDYGRPRELHLDHGVAVSHPGPHEITPERMALAPWREQLAAGPYFRIEHLLPAAAIQIEAPPAFYLLLICVRGSGTIAGAPFCAGECWLVPAGSPTFKIDGPGSEWILTYTAEEPAEGIQQV